MALNPNDTSVEKEYVFEIHGEVVVTDYSEEQAEEQIKQHFSDLIWEGLKDNSFQIKLDRR